MHLRRLTDTKHKACLAARWLASHSKVDAQGRVSTTATLYTITKRDPKNGPLPRHAPTMVHLGDHNGADLLLGFFADASAFLATTGGPTEAAPNLKTPQHLTVGARLLGLEGVRIHMATLRSPRNRVLFDRSGGSLRFGANGNPLFELIDATLYGHLLPLAQNWFGRAQQDARDLWDGMADVRYSPTPTLAHPAPPWTPFIGNFRDVLDDTLDAEGYRATWMAHAKGPRLAAPGLLVGAWYHMPKRDGTGLSWCWIPTHFTPQGRRSIPVPATVQNAFVAPTLDPTHGLQCAMWSNGKLVARATTLDVAPSAHQALAIASRAR